MMNRVTLALVPAVLSACLAHLSFAQPADTKTASLATQFANPGPEYRGKPFWSWNGDLKQDELIRQIRVLKDMGMGGFFMHSRTGLITEYMGDEWFRLINACADEASKLGMEAWLYDEDRWPSGTAGGIVTEDPKYRARFISLNTVPAERFKWQDGIVAAFSCRLKGLSYTDCHRIAASTPAGEYQGMTVLVFTVEEMEKSSFYNGYTYVDTLSRAATDRFIQLTHEKYKARSGQRLAASIKGIFTDEPHRGPVMNDFGISNANRERMAPWTDALPARFKERFGYDLVDSLPELFLRPDGQAARPVKWQYMDLLQQMFLDNFARPIHDWCRQNNMLFTGHVLHEDSLSAQACMQGSLMRFYEHMDYPGVDVLTEGNRNYWIVKQLSSAARQLGRRWMLSELYGCTGWQFNFESHKTVGDWQALFGINIRCPHLSWYTMEGEAKRDYPASIFYQSAWWKDYHYVETYYARLGLILNQGQPACDVLVINPIESVWCQINAGWARGLSGQSPEVQSLERGYQELFHWLAGAHIDFDYGDEEMIGRLYRIDRDAAGQPILRVGQAQYRAVVVGRMTTMRLSTLRILNEFRNAGGTVIFAGDAPAYIDAVRSPAAAELAARCTRSGWSGDAVVAGVNPALHTPVEIRDSATSANLGEVFCQLRQDGATAYLVAMNMSRDKWFRNARIRVRGSGEVSQWNCLTGERYAVAARSANGRTEFTADFAPSGEQVFVLTPRKIDGLIPAPRYTPVSQQVCQRPFEYKLGEKNVCVLDIARYRIVSQPWQNEAEVLKADQAIRTALKLPFRGGEMVQPWFRNKLQPQAKAIATVQLAFDFQVEAMPRTAVQLCMERPELFSVTLNGRSIPSSSASGWWVDPVIRTLPIPSEFLREGTNTVRISAPFHDGVNIEALYLIGDFGVRLDGTRKILTTLPEKIATGDLAAQGLPFYSGPITYRLVLPSRPAAGQRVLISTPKFEAACIKVSAGGRSPRLIAWQPYQADVTDALSTGATLDLEVVLTRRNTFGPLHQVPLRAGAYGPGNWTTGGPGFSMNYMLYPSGLLEAPVFVVVETADDQ